MQPKKKQGVGQNKNFGKLHSTPFLRATRGHTGCRDQRT